MPRGPWSSLKICLPPKIKNEKEYIMYIYVKRIYYIYFRQTLGPNTPEMIFLSVTY